MPIDIKVPALPESVADATVLDWHQKVGDLLQRDQKLVDLETDKVVLEVVAPHAGTLTAILKASGETVNADEVLAVFEPMDAGDHGTQAKPAEAPTPSATAPTPEPPPKPTPQAASPPAPAHTATATSTPPPSTATRPPPGPAARRLLEQHGLDASLVSGSGPKGRITQGDVLSFMAGDAHQTVPAHNSHRSNGQVQRPSDNIDAPEPLPFPESGTTAVRPEQRAPMTRLRRRIAERLVDAQHSAAMLTTFNEVDMAAVKQLRARHRDAFERQHGIKLGFMSFFVKAVLHALAQFPLVNASIDGDDIIYHGYYDIGIAVSTPRGLVVPIIRDAEQLSFAGIEQAIATLASRARDGKLTIDELTGGTFSITNGGTFGSLLSTPILNPPQTAILGMHKIQDRPVAVDGQVVIRPVMYLALSYDHRLVDGADAVRFLVAIKDALEDPARLLLDI